MVRNYLYLILGVLLLSFQGCGSDSKAPSRTSSPANAPKSRELPTPPVSVETPSVPKANASRPPARSSLPETKPPAKREASFPHFPLRDLDHRSSALIFEKDRVRFQNIRQRIVILTLLSDRCAPCRGMMPYLTMLQKKYAKDLFVLGVLVRSDLDDEELRRFMRRHESNFYLSNHPDGDRLGSFLASRLDLGSNYPLPLTLIYKDGKYIMHIQGAVPYEMLSHLVEGLIHP